MVRSVLVLALVSRLAWAEPEIYQPQEPVTVVAPSWVLTPKGKENIDSGVALLWSEKERLRAENEALRADVIRLAGEPALTWRGALFLVGAGLVVGAAVGIPVALAVRR